MSFIITSPKVKYTAKVQKGSRVGWRSRESKEIRHKELELGCLLAKDGSIKDGQHHSDLASESECANPRGQDI